MAIKLSKLKKTKSANVDKLWDKHVVKKQTAPKAADFESKPKIEDVMQIFQDFHQGMVYIMRTPENTWQDQMVSRRESLKARLKGIGLAKHIDWPD